jgi:simple sugar transport system permease protein
MILILGIAPEITLVYKAGVVAVVCLIQSPEARALLARAVRTDRPTAPPPSSPAAALEPVPDVTELVDIAANVNREP